MERFPLSRALRLDEPQPRKALVALAGGGGKTTTLFTLATELAAQGRRVVTSTSTRLFAAQRAQSPAWCAVGDEPALRAALARHGQCLVTAEVGTEAAKAQGLSEAALMTLYGRDDVDVLLVEADGSRARPFKAPAPHEPVIPAATTLLVSLVGADAFGKALDATTVHRPERVAALGGVPLGTPLTPDVVVRVLLHAAGGRQHLPDGARWVPFFNKVEQAADALMAARSAQQLLAAPRVSEVLLGSLHRLRAGAAGALERRSRSAAVLLAAGESRRFGQNKPLLRWEGQPLVARAAALALEVCDTVLVVVGHEADAVAAAVEHLPVEVVWNPSYGHGQGSSVAAGARALLGPARPWLGEAFFMVADQPLLTAELLEGLRAVRGLRRIAAPRHGTRRGNPVLWDRALFPALATLSGETGGRALFEAQAEEIAWLELADETPLHDVDTPEAWAALKAGHGQP